MPYAIEKIDTSEIVRRFGSPPKSLEVEIDGHKRRIIAPVAVGDEGLGYRFIEVAQVDFNQPGVYFTKGDLVVTREGNVRTETQEWVAWTQTEIDAYELGRKRAVANQFDEVNDIVRLAVLATQQELNRTNRIVEALGLAIVSGGSLAAVKTNVQNLPEKPRETTPAQMKAAIEAALGL